MASVEAAVRAAYDAAGQGHIFRFYDRLPPEQQQQLLEEARQHDPHKLNEMLSSALSGKAANTNNSDNPADATDSIRPPNLVDLSPLNTLLQKQQVRRQQQQKHQNQQQDDEKDLAAAYRALLAGAGACGVVSLKSSPSALKDYWRNVGLRLIAEGKVGVLLLAGGDGSRLGFEGPKGSFPIAPLSQKSFFCLYAQRLQQVAALAAATADTSNSSNSNGSGGSSVNRCKVPLYIMTSPLNRAATEACFALNGYFGLNPQEVFIFSQATTPVFNSDRLLMLSSPHSLRAAPSGNGGLFRGFSDSGALVHAAKKGLQGLQVLSVDNALARVGDPVFFGFAYSAHSHVANKVVVRRSPKESIGVVCQMRTALPCLLQQQRKQQQQQGQPRQPAQQQQQGRWAGGVAEYSELPPSLAEDGALYAWGNVCMHYFSLAFIQAVTSNLAVYEKGFHAAKKKIPELVCLNHNSSSNQRAAKATAAEAETPATHDVGTPMADDPRSWALKTPTEANGWKLELFIFDAFAFADRVLCLEVEREEEFAPVKVSGSIEMQALEGQGLEVASVASDTPEHAQLLLSRLHAKWVAAATSQSSLPGRQPEAPHHIFCEVSPLLSYEGEGISSDCLKGKDLSKPLLLRAPQEKP